MYAVKREGTRGNARGQTRPITKEAKKIEGKENVGLTTYRHAYRRRPVHQKVALFHTPTSTHFTPNTNLGLLPPRSHPVLAVLGISVRICAPLVPLPTLLVLTVFRYRDPTNLSVTCPKTTISLPAEFPKPSFVLVSLHSF